MEHFVYDHADRGREEKIKQRSYLMSVNRPTFLLVAACVLFPLLSAAQTSQTSQNTQKTFRIAPPADAQQQQAQNAPVQTPAVQTPAAVNTNRNESEEFDFAGGLFSRGMYDMAAEEYQKFVKKYPVSTFRELAYYRIAESFFLGKSYSSALLWYGTYKGMFPDGQYFYNAKLREGQIFLILEDYKKSEEVLSELTKLKTKADITAGAMYYLGQGYFKRGDYDAAVKILDKVVNDFASTVYSSFAYANLGDIYVKKGEYDKALDLYAKVIAMATDGELKTHALLASADANYVQTRYKQAYEFYREAVKIASGPSVTDDAVIGLFSSLYNDGKFKEILEIYNAYKDKISDPEVQSRLLFIIGNSLLSSEKFNDAADTFKKLEKDYKDTNYGKKAVLNAAWALYKTEDVQKALDEVEAFLKEVNQRSAEALYLKAKIFDKLKKKEDAVKTLEEILKEFDKNDEYYKEALFELGRMYDMYNFVDKASKYYTDYLSKYPEDAKSAEVLLKIGQNYLKTGNYKEAENVYLSFLSKYPSHPLRENVLYQLGNIYLETKNYEKLVGAYGDFLKEFPDSKGKNAVLYWQGYGYRELGKWDEAVRTFGKIEKDGKNKYYDQGREGAAYSYFQMNRNKEAAGEYFALISGNPDYLLPQGVYVWAAEYFCENNENKRSLDMLAALKYKFPNDTPSDRAIYLTAENYRCLGETEKAITLFKDAILKNISAPYYEKSYLSLGRAYAGKKKYKEAVDSFEKALEKHSDNYVGAYARLDMAKVNMLLNNYEDAAKTFMMVAILYDDKTLAAEALYMAGEAFKAADLTKNAEEAWGELLSKFPESEYAARAKQEMGDLNGKK
ncbi:MAG: tetratricopeptide repeat protein [Candidatus Omnitrophica bacterium]|nr:tetratricopeptide repeat protein [Candidatus Omnitrophota bacterium]